MPEEEKCPVCKGIPQYPEISGCHGCLECDFHGTKSNYDRCQAMNEEAHAIGLTIDRSDDDDSQCEGVLYDV